MFAPYGIKHQSYDNFFSFFKTIVPALTKSVSVQYHFFDKVNQAPRRNYFNIPRAVLQKENLCMYFVGDEMKILCFEIYFIHKLEKLLLEHRVPKEFAQANAHSIQYIKTTSLKVRVN